MSSRELIEPVEVKEDVFFEQYNSKFFGVLMWPQLDELWKTLKEGNLDWYIYAVGEEPPENPVDKKTLHNFIIEVDTLLRREHDEDYCGIVYTNNQQEPSFIKIFDPNNVGTSCGTASTSPLPGWILSISKPIDIPAALLQTSLAQPNNRKRWWKKIFS